MAQETERKKSICMWCKAECGVLVYVKDGHLVGIEEDPDFPRKVYPPTKSCIRRLAASEFVYHPDRIKYPLKRIGPRGGGRWERITAEQALDEIAGKLGEVRQTYGAEALASTLGTYRTHFSYCSRFMNLYGSPNNLGQSQICFGPRCGMANAICGMFPPYSVSAASRCIVLIGIEPRISRPIAYKALLDARKHGAKLIVIDPRGTHSAERADIWLQLRPGTDCALLMGMINVMIEEGLYDKEFVSGWCLGFDQLKEHAQQYPLNKVEEITQVPAEQIRAAALLYATNKPGCVLEGMGVEQSQNNSQTLHARWILTALAGNIDVEGGEVFPGPDVQLVNEREIELVEKLPAEQRRKQLGSDRFKLLSRPGYELVTKNVGRVWGKPGGTAMEQCRAHAPTVYRAIITGKPYPVKALITVASNPMVTQANTKLVYQALKSQNLDLYVVMDFFMTPSAELADYVIPAACWLERPCLDTFMDYGNYICAGEAALPSSLLGQYEYLLDYDFWRGLGIRLGQQAFWPWKTLEEAYDFRLQPLGQTFRRFVNEARFKKREQKYKKYLETGFGTPSGKVELYSTVLRELGYDPLPQYEEPKGTIVSDTELAKEYPVTLTTGARNRPLFHSEWRQVPFVRKRHPEPLAKIHPATARRFGIANGDWIWIETITGRVRQRASLSDRIREGAVEAEHGWWFPELPGEEPCLHGVWESNINVCMDDAPERCNQVLGSWPLRTALCKVYKVKQ